MTRLVLAEIRRRFISEARPLDAETEAALRVDPRPGAKTILATVAQRRSANRAEGQRLRHLLRFESALWATGVVHIAGVDEAGVSSSRRACGGRSRRLCTGIADTRDQRFQEARRRHPEQTRNRDQGKCRRLVSRLCGSRGNR